MTIQKGVFAEKVEIENADKPKGEYDYLLLNPFLDFF